MHSEISIDILTGINFADSRCFILKRKATAFIKNWISTKDKKALLSRVQDKQEKQISLNDLQKKTIKNLLK